MSESVAVWNVDRNGYLRGDIYTKENSDSIQSRVGHTYNMMSIVPVPAALELKDVNDLKAVDVSGTWEIQEKVPADYSKTERITQEGQALADGVYTELSQVFATQKPEVATAWYLTAMAMQSDPAYFSSNGLEVEVATATFAIGDTLETDAKVTLYSGELLSAAKQYSMLRMLRYKTYRTNKASIAAL